jgi:hypothetical protein
VLRMAFPVEEGFELFLFILPVCAAGR